MSRCEPHGQGLCFAYLPPQVVLVRNRSGEHGAVARRKAVLIEDANPVLGIGRVDALQGRGVDEKDLGRSGQARNRIDAVTEDGEPNLVEVVDDRADGLAVRHQSPTGASSRQHKGISGRLSAFGQRGSDLLTGTKHTSSNSLGLRTRARPRGNSSWSWRSQSRCCCW